MKLLQPYLQSKLVQVVSGWPWFLSTYSSLPLRAGCSPSGCLNDSKGHASGPKRDSHKLPPVFGAPKVGQGHGEAVAVLLRRG